MGSERFNGSGGETELAHPIDGLDKAPIVPVIAGLLAAEVKKTRNQQPMAEYARLALSLYSGIIDKQLNEKWLRTGLNQYQPYKEYMKTNPGGSSIEAIALIQGRNPDDAAQIIINVLKTSDDPASIEFLAELGYGVGRQVAAFDSDPNAF